MTRIKYSPALREFRTCEVVGCQEPPGAGWFSFSGKCPLHETVAKARELRPTEFDRLRRELATTPPISDEERRVRRASAALHTLQWHARDLHRSKKAAREAGATKDQVADAIKRGRADA